MPGFSFIKPGCRSFCNFCSPILKSNRQTGFNMKNYFLLAALFLGYVPTAFAQNPNRLLQKLPSLKGKERIDSLIEIAKLYNARHDDDSVLYFSKIINQEATKLNYEHGIALSLLGLNVRLDSLQLQLQNVKQAIQMGEKLNDNEVLAWAYGQWGFLVSGASGKYEKKRIELFRKSLYYAQKARDIICETTATLELCQSCSVLGEEEGVEYCKKSIQLAKQIQSSFKDWEIRGEWVHVKSLILISYLYGYQAGDYNTALSYKRLARETAKLTKEHWQIEDIMSMMFNKIGLYDSSLYYLQILAQRKKHAFVDVLFGETYFLKKDFGKAQYLFQNALDSTKKHPWEEIDLRASIGLAKCLEVKKDYKSALKAAMNSCNISKLAGDRDFSFPNKLYIMDIYEVLARLYHQLEKDDSAYYYLQQYTILKDSATNKQHLWKLNMKLYEYKKEAEEERKTSQLNLLHKENQLKEQKLKQQTLVRNSLIAAIVLLFLLGIFIFRNLLLKRKNERLKMQKNLEVHRLENEKKQADLEMQALRAQMNPHFIFNCLSSINRFILKNEGKTASNYLTRFSRLMRMVLMNSQKPLITLENELEMLGLYLEMERLRFKNSFDYGITFLNTIDAGNIFIPPLLLQPFCENAIWHGLMHLPAGRDGNDDQGRLDIVLTMQDKVLNCIITDNGIGREKAEEMKSKTAEREKSMGLKITKERLALLNREKSLHTFYQIEDLKDENGKAAGTKVVLNISFKESVEETV